MKNLEIGKRFNSTFQIWQWANYDDISEMKTVLDNCFQKLGIDCAFLGYAKCDANNPKDKAWWDEILSYSREKGYAIQPLCMGPGGSFWESMTPDMLRYLSSKYPDVIQLVCYASERWAMRERYIFPDRLLLVGDDSKSDPNSIITVPIEETEIGHPLMNTYSDMTTAMKLTYGRELRKICEAAPQAVVSFSDHWLTVDVAALLNEPYAKQLAPGRKSFGATNTLSYSDLQREGRIKAWMTQLSSDGAPQPSFTPDYMERMLKRTIVEGASFWELQDEYFFGPVMLDNPASPDAKLTPWGKAFRAATDYGHVYNSNTLKPVQWDPDTGIAFLCYPNNTGSNGITTFHQMATIEANHIFTGFGLPFIADDPVSMLKARLTDSGTDPMKSWYTPPYFLEDYQYYPGKRFYYSSCITPKTKVALFSGPGNMTQAEVDKLKAYCHDGGYVIQACGAYIHDPETGMEMLDFEKNVLQLGGSYTDDPSYKEPTAFIYPKPSQMRTALLNDLAGFSFEEVVDSKGYFKCETADLTTPLIQFTYGTEYRGGGNSFADFYLLKGKLEADTVPVLTFYDRKGDSYPLVIFHKIGKGGVYTVLSWSLGGMTADFLSEFIRKWVNHLVDKYDGDILKRDKVNLYDYEVYAGRLLDWEDRPYIEMTADQQTGIVKNYLDKPITRVFTISAQPSEKAIQETITDSDGKVTQQNTINVAGNNPTLVTVTLYPGDTVTLKKA